MRGWSIYAMGIITGTAALLGAERLVPRAEAAPALPRVAAAQDNVGGVILAAVGSSEVNRNDILWVVYKRPLSPVEQKKYPGRPRDRITITAYRAPAGLGAPVSLNLRAARNATLDHELDELIGGNRTVRAVAEQLRNH